MVGADAGWDAGFEFMPTSLNNVATSSETHLFKLCSKFLGYLDVVFILNVLTTGIYYTIYEVYI